MATSRSRLSSWAFQTSPMPPSPMRSSSRYRPRTVPGSMGKFSAEVFRKLAVTAQVISLVKRPATNRSRGMAKSLADASARQELVGRLGRLRPDASRRWGKMTAPQMLAHLADWMLMASGEMRIAPRRRILRFPPVKQLAIYWLPFPKGIPTAPELVARAPMEWSVEHATVCERVESFGDLYRRGQWPEHPVFAVMSPAAWGVLGYRHTDHHLRQFGV